MDYITIILLLFIILKQFIMSEDLNQIKDDLLAANQTITTAAETAVKIDADVEALHAKIDALSDNPDAEAIAEIKALSTSLKESLVVVDEKTEDVPVVEEPTE